MRAYGGWLKVFTLPYTVEYTTIHMLESKNLDLGVYLPRHRPRRRGSSTAPTSRRSSPSRRTSRRSATWPGSVASPSACARSRGTSHRATAPRPSTPASSTTPRAPAPSKVELWGSVDGVARALVLHNGATRVVAKRNPGVLFTDVEIEMPEQGRYFNDVCHLSEEGKREWLRLVIGK